MKKKTVCYYPHIYCPLKDEVFKNPNSWEYQLKENLKKENIEIHTYDITPISKADYVLVFDNLFYQNLPIFEEIIRYKKMGSSVYINYEPITGHAKNHDAKGMYHLSHIFNKIVTFDDDMVDNKKFIKGDIANFYSDEKQYKGDYQNRKLLTMISNRTTVDVIIQILNYYNETSYFNKKNIKKEKQSIYSEREKAVSYFAKKCPDKFDLYGNYWPSKYKKVFKGYAPREEKLDILSQYKFAISYDSYTNQNGYISEKIFDCFLAKTIPIYLGADNVGKYIPKNCFIHKKDFKNYKDLYQYLINMDEKTYNQYIKNIEKYLESDQFKKYFSSESSANILSNALLKTGEVSYTDAVKSLHYFTDKRDELYKGVAYYNLDKIHYDTNKISVSLKLEVGKKVMISSNGLAKDIYLTVKNRDHITVYLNTKVRRLYLEVYDMDEKKYIPFKSYEPLKVREYGLIPIGLKKTTLRYFEYTSLNKFQKLFYVLFHNPNKIIRKIKKEKIIF